MVPYRVLVLDDRIHEKDGEDARATISTIRDCITTELINRLNEDPLSTLCDDLLESLNDGYRQEEVFGGISGLSLSENDGVVRFDALDPGWNEKDGDEEAFINVDELVKTRVYSQFDLVLVDIAWRDQTSSEQYNYEFMHGMSQFVEPVIFKNSDNEFVKNNVFVLSGKPELLKQTRKRLLDSSQILSRGSCGGPLASRIVNDLLARASFHKLPPIALSDITNAPFGGVVLPTAINKGANEGGILLPGHNWRGDKPCQIDANRITVLACAGTSASAIENVRLVYTDCHSAISKIICHIKSSNASEWNLLRQRLLAVVDALKPNRWKMHLGGGRDEVQKSISKGIFNKLCQVAGVEEFKQFFPDDVKQKPHDLVNGWIKYSTLNDLYNGKGDSIELVRRLILSDRNWWRLSHVV